jgi:hypothetical protein
MPNSGVEPQRASLVGVLTLLQATIVGTLVFLSPYAMHITPNAGTYLGSDIRLLARPLESFYLAPDDLIAFGVKASMLAGLVACVLSLRVRKDSVTVPAWSAAVCAFALGWKSFPYWANGVFAAYVGAAPVWDFDPKRLPPMTWIGDLWRVAVVLSYPFCVGFVPVLVLGSLQLLRSPETRARGAASCGMLVLVVLCFACSPGYMKWLMD